MIDTHCHIDFDEFDEDRDNVISRAKEKLNAVINSGYGLESNAKALALSKEYEGFVCCGVEELYGIHWRAFLQDHS